MKIALCMSGHMRTWSKAYDNLEKYILSTFDTDIYISTWSSIENHHLGNFEDDRLVNLEQIQSLYGNRLKICEIENYLDLVCLFENYSSKIINNVGPGCQPIRAISMFYKNYKAINLIRELDYDVVIKTRPDLIYFNQLVIEDTDEFHIPVERPYNNGKIYNGDINYFVGSINDTFGGYPDSVVYSNKKNMLKFAELYNKYFDYWTGGCLFHPELLLKHHLGQIKRSDFGVEILRENKKKDGNFYHSANNETIFY